MMFLQRQKAESKLKPNAVAPIPIASPNAKHQPAWTNALPLQPKLTVNQPGDQYEQEADRMAGQVMRMSAPTVQRCACGGVAGPDGECAACKAKRLARQQNQAPVLQREAISSSPLRVARGEKWDAFWGVGPWDAYKSKKLADQALKRAQDTGLPGPHNGPADAWRHCYWNCTMTKEMDAEQAQTIADNHEKHGGGPAIENQMDKYNNLEGRACGVSDSNDCDQCCQDLLDNGQLRVIDSATNKLTPSSKTPRGTPPKPGSGTYKY